MERCCCRTPEYQPAVRRCLLSRQQQLQLHQSWTGIATTTHLSLRPQQQSSRLLLGMWVFLAVSAAVTIRPVRAVIGDVLAQYQLVTRQPAQQVQIIVGPGNSTTFWAAATLSNPPSISVNAMSISTSGKMNRTFTFFASEFPTLELALLFYNETAGSAVQSSSPDFTIFLMGLASGIYQAAKYAYSQAKLSYYFVRLCSGGFQFGLRVNPLFVPSGGTWQVLLCPDGRQLLRCSDPVNPTRTATNATGYSMVGNGTLLLVAFVDSLGSLVCIYGVSDINGGGVQAVSATATFPGYAIVSTAAFEQTTTKSIVFLSTNSGNGLIFRSYLSINNQAKRYLMFDMIGLSVNGSGGRGTNITFIDNKLIVPVSDMLYAVDTLDDCSYSNASNITCNDCVTWKRKYCGWCYSTSRCTTYTHCTVGWIPANPTFTPSCPGADTIKPSSAAIGSTVTVIINANITELNSKCSFSKAGVIPFLSIPTITTDGKSLQCSTPNASYFSTSGTFTVMFSLYYAEDPNVIYVATDYTYVDCSMQTSCSSCLLAHPDCVWCRNEQRCIVNALRPCPSGDLTSAVLSADIQKCPTVQNIGPKTVPCIKATQTINIDISNFPAPASARYECRIIGGSVSTAAATQNGPSQVTCEASLCNVSTNQFQTIIGVTLWRNDAVAVANMGGSPVNITLYNCDILKSCFDCTMQQNAGFGCAWCRASACSSRSCSDRSDKPDNCSALLIDNSKMELSSPVEGSNFTLRGWGLGNGSYEQVKDSITINNLRCPTISYSKLSDRSSLSDSIVCQVPRSTMRGSVSIVVRIAGVTWQNAFYYFDPQITSLEKPGYGLVSGGIISALHGLDLDYLSVPSYSVYLKGSGTNEIEIDECDIPINSSTLMNCTMPKVNVTGNYSFSLTFYGGLRRDSTVTFTYYPDPIVVGIQPQSLKGTVSGGQKVTVIGNNFLGVVNPPSIRLSNPISKRSLRDEKLLVPPGFESLCTVNTSSRMLCTIPSTASLNRTSMLPATFTATLQMDQANITILPSITIYPDPVLTLFTTPLPYNDLVVLEGANLIYVYSQNDYSVLVGGIPCQTRPPADTTLVFTPPALDKLINVSASSDRIFNITVTVDRFTFKPGSINYNVANNTVTSTTVEASKDLIIGISCGGVAAVAIILVAAFLYRRKAKYHERQYKKSMHQLNQMEINVRNECKQAFAELQADMTNLTNDMVVTGIPYWDYGNFTYKILFPGSSHSQSLSRLTTKSKGSTVLAMNKFELLVCSRTFLALFIHTLEEQDTFSVADRVSVASLVMLILQNKMDYATLVLKDLLSHLIRAKVKKTNAKLLLRSSESVVERMLTHWLSLCLYKYIQDYAGMPLFLLFKAIKQQIEKGPVDCLTQEARYSLSEERLLREKVDAHSLTLSVIQDFSSELLPCRVLDCDSISQVKEKILDALYRNTAYSLRPNAMDYLLVWRPSLAEIPLEDEDSTSEIVAGWKRLNTLAHYSVPDQAVVQLCLKSASLGTHSSRKSKGGGSDTFLLSPHSSHVTTTERHSVVNKWHLSKHRQQTLPKEKQQETMVSEIFLTRLVKTKGTLQEFIDKLFTTIFSSERLPPVIKFLFDFLDEEYKACGINDPEVLHIWKNNSLHLRFWINLIKNPDFVFDVSKSPVVDSCLTVVAQTLIDSCSITESDYGADAPVNKLLFAKDRPHYRKMVEKYYADIRSQPQATEQELNIYLNTISSMYPKDFYRSSALQELYHYAKKYMPQLLSKLDEEGGEKSHQVAMSLLHINEILDSVHHQGPGVGAASISDNTMYSFV